MLMPNPTIIPLSELGSGRTAVVHDIDGGRRLTHRLTEMGLYRGAQVEVLASARGGPVILMLGPSRLALGRGMAEKIMVGPKPGTL